MAQRPVRRPPAKKRAGRSDIAVISIIGVIAIVAAFIFQSYNTEGFNLDVKKDASGQTAAVAEIHSGDVRINEVMAANDSAYYTQDGESSDWVEIMNIGSSTVNISGYTLAKSTSATDQFVFPDQYLEPGQCVLVFCDSKNRATAGYEYHAPFSISRAGDTVLLFNSAGTAVDSVNVPEVFNNLSYSRDDGGAWQLTTSYTPGMGNTEENHETLVSAVVQGNVEITEIMSKNMSYAPDSTGAYHDYIELHNTSSSELDVSGYYISDDKDDVMKWRIPDLVIPANGYAIIYASGLDKSGQGEYHASFKLSSEGEFAVISNAMGQPLDIVEFPLLNADQAYSKGADGNFTTTIPPTPGMANTQSSAATMSNRFAAQNNIGIYINEIAASTTEANYDWVEIYNSTGSAVDLSNWGLSDNSSKPRKWAFPQGTVIQPGGYVGVFMSGLTSSSDAQLHADFKLSADGGYMLTLCDPNGTILDRVYVGQQYSNITYARVPETGTYAFYTTSTPVAANAGTYYTRKADIAGYSVTGGVFDAGETVTVELTCEPGDKIYYTTDSTDPDTGASLYTSPISISDTTVLRTRVYGEGALESYMSCQTYIFGESHTVRVVSLVSDPYNLTSEEAGIMIKGPNATSKHPYGSMNYGANFWMDWEREGHIEIYEPNGEQIVSQGIGLKLHGQYSRSEPQQAFKIYARSAYSGKNAFDADLFTKRGYSEYSSFLLRSSGQDTDKTRMRDSILCGLAEDTSVFYQETELCVVYLDGVYWGHYNMREHITATSICQFEGWEGQEDDIDIVKANSNVMQGSNDTYAQLLSWVNSNNTNTDEAYAYIDSAIDIQNFIEYMSVEMFTGNTDTLNVKRYRNPNGDGKWRWVLFDLDWAFITDTNSIRRWLAPGGMGNQNRTNNDLFIACMKNDRFKDMFLTYFGEQMATTFSTKNVVERIMERYYLLEPELERQLAKWGPTKQVYMQRLNEFIAYAEERPTKLIREYFQSACGLTDEQMTHYFGDAVQAIYDYQSSQGG